MESYPRHAPPLVFVNPTRDMIIKCPHPFVSPNGVVSIPYIHSWVFPASNLVDLGRNLSHFFALDPPLLYSQQRNLNQSYGSMNSPRDYLPSTAEVFKKNAIAKLVESLNDVFKEMKEVQDEKEALEQQLQMVLMRENEGKTGNNDECDGLSKQLLDCTASDLAIEDTIYALDKALQEGVIPVHQYFRNIRRLSREQFLHRATGMKVRAIQMQAQVASMAPPFPFT